jgi:uncharacterized flavoprotein (TIGR03862 family)
MLPSRNHILIIGGGPAGLMAADVLAETCEVDLFDKETRIGKKFLVAGKGGFNITNGATGDALLAAYSPAGFLDIALNACDNHDVRHWLLEMGIPTFTGSSGRVFPEKGIHPAEVLNRITARLKAKGVRIHTENEVIGFDTQQQVVFKNPEGDITLKTDYVILALGGASWPDTGSDGAWRELFERMGIQTLPFQSSNCGVNVGWPNSIGQFHCGKPVKNVRLFNETTSVQGELLITDYGLEGNAVYRLVPALRERLNNQGQASLHIDFKPLNPAEQLLQKVRGKNFSTRSYAEIFHLTPVQLAIIKAFSSRATYADPEHFATLLKDLEIPVLSLRPVEEAISVVGGVALEELNPDFSLKKYPWIYVAGEMADWDAPPGGFLLQGCFSMGHFAASAILKKLQ